MTDSASSRSPTARPVLRALDKLQLAEAAEAVGLTVPETRVCSGAAEALTAARDLGFPVLLKPAHSVYTVNGETRRSGSVLVADADRLAALAPAYGEPCLLQRHVGGQLVSVGGVLAGGRLLGTAVSVYRRTWRPETGNVSFSTTIEPEPELTRSVERLLSELEWEGMFEVELIAHEQGGYAAIDVNPRPYGSLALALGAGANLPVLWAEWALGGAPQPAQARPGGHYRWEDAELRNLIWRLRRGRLFEAARVLLPRRGAVHPHFAASDPGPLVARFLTLARRAATRARRSSGVRTRDAGEPPDP